MFSSRSTQQIENTYIHAVSILEIARQVIDKLDSDPSLKWALMIEDFIWHDFSGD